MLLYKLLRKSSANVAVKGAGYDEIEKAYPGLFKSNVTLIEDFEIGIEVEVEKVEGDRAIVSYPVWSTHPDGSLRSGIEFVTKPIQGPRVNFALNWLFHHMSSYNFSPRTSIHIHLNVLDLTLQQVAGLVMTYMLFERQFYKYAGGDRDKSNFCVPILDTSTDVIQCLISPQYEVPNWQEGRYMGLNLAAIGKFGTVEFRHLGGTDNKEKILNWINLIFCLKRYAKAHDFASIKARIDRMNTDSSYSMFLNEVFGDQAKFLPTVDLKTYMEEAVTMVKRYANGGNSWRVKLSGEITNDDTWFVFLSKPVKKEVKSEFTWPARATRAGQRREGVEQREEAYIRDYDDELEVAPRPARDPIAGLGGLWQQGAVPDELQVQLDEAARRVTIRPRR